jgi:hypothetical protein
VRISHGLSPYLAFWVADTKYKGFGRAMFKALVKIGQKKPPVVQDDQGLSFRGAESELFVWMELGFSPP